MLPLGRCWRAGFGRCPTTVWRGLVSTLRHLARFWWHLRSIQLRVGSHGCRWVLCQFCGSTGGRLCGACCPVLPVSRLLPRQVRIFPWVHLRPGSGWRWTCPPPRCWRNTTCTTGGLWCESATCAPVSFATLPRSKMSCQCFWGCWLLVLFRRMTHLIQHWRLIAWFLDLCLWIQWWSHSWFV